MPAVDFTAGGGGGEPLGVRGNGELVEKSGAGRVECEVVLAVAE
jgi:hypothetical protein